MGELWVEKRISHSTPMIQQNVKEKVKIWAATKKRIEEETTRKAVSMVEDRL